MAYVPIRGSLRATSEPLSRRGARDQRHRDFGGPWARPQPGGCSAELLRERTIGAGAGARRSVLRERPSQRCRHRQAQALGSADLIGSKDMPAGQLREARPDERSQTNERLTSKRATLAFEHLWREGAPRRTPVRLPISRPPAAERARDGRPTTPGRGPGTNAGRLRRRRAGR